MKCIRCSVYEPVHAGRCGECLTEILCEHENMKVDEEELEDTRRQLEEAGVGTVQYHLDGLERALGEKRKEVVQTIDGMLGEINKFRATAKSTTVCKKKIEDFEGID